MTEQEPNDQQLYGGLAELGEELRAFHQIALDTGEMPAEAWRTIYQLAVLTDGYHHRLSRERFWRLLAAVEHLGQLFTGHNQNFSLVNPEAELLRASPFHRAVDELSQAARQQLDWQDPGVVRQKIETVAELTEQKVPDRQICLIYKWMLPGNVPDIARLKQARQTEPDAPRYVEREPVWPATWPRHRPTLRHALDLIAYFERQEQEAKEASQPYRVGGVEIQPRDSLVG